MSRGVWKAMETSAREVRMGKTEGRRSKRRKGRKEREERIEEKPEEEKDGRS